MPFKPILLTICAGALIGNIGCKPLSDNLEKDPRALNQVDCRPIEGVAELLSETGPEIIVIGELHGMEETPAFIEALMCHSVSQGLKTALALEMMDKAGRLEAYLASDGGQSAKAVYFEDDLWQNDFTFGLSSQAIFKLIERARSLSQSYGLKVITFLPENDAVQGILNGEFQPTDGAFSRNDQSAAQELAMARNILNRSEAAKADKTIVLVGNLHALRSHVKFGELDYPAMAAHMPSPKTLTLNAITQGGLAWNCIGATSADCGPHPTGPQVNPESDLAKSDVFTIMLGHGRERLPNISPRSYKPDNYDGVVYVGTATASPPANEKLREP